MNIDDTVTSDRNRYARSTSGRGRWMSDGRNTDVQCVWDETGTSASYLCTRHPLAHVSRPVPFGSAHFQSKIRPSDRNKRSTDSQVRIINFHRHSPKDHIDAKSDMRFSLFISRLRVCVCVCVEITLRLYSFHFFPFFAKKVKSVISFPTDSHVHLSLFIL